MNRIKKIIKVSTIGIITNIFLVIFKTIIGWISGSISIIMDSINNLSDALSSIVTIVGVFFSKKEPDKEHPYGHGKIEYITSLFIAIIILFTGISFIVESYKKITDNSIATYTPIMLILISVAVITKIVLGTYFKKSGKKLNSNSLIASGIDAMFDALISFSTLVSALIAYFFKISIDGYLGIIIALIIIKSAYKIMSDSFNNIIGTKIDKDIVNKIQKTINKNNKVLGTYDLELHQYGPERIYGSIHIEIEDSLKAKDIHKLTKRISDEIYEKYGVSLTIGIYSTNTYKDIYAKIKKSIERIIKKYPSIKQFHGYYIDTEKNDISFDLLFDYNEKDTLKIKDEIITKLEKKYDTYKFKITIDNDYND